MGWTKEIPTVDGWFWIWIKTEQTLVVDYINSGTIQTWNSVNTKWEATPLDSLDWEFYGPLEEPK